MSSRKDTKNARILGARLPDPDDKKVRSIVRMYFKDVNEEERVLEAIANAHFSASLAYTYDLAERSGLSQSEFVEHFQSG